MRHILYDRWHTMIRRCYDPYCKDYNRYGGRGIIVCERWHNFINFVEDMYPSFKNGLTIDRKNNNGNYEPKNCKWSTWKEQRINRDDCSHYTINNVSKPLYHWCIEYNIDYGTVKHRMNKGMDLIKALTIVPGKLEKFKYTGKDLF